MKGLGMIRSIARNLKDSVRNVRQAFGFYRPEEHIAFQSEHENKRSRRHLPTRAGRGRAHMIRWAEAYNARNGGIIPAKSVESIYYKAHKKYKTRAKASVATA